MLIVAEQAYGQNRPSPADTAAVNKLIKSARQKGIGVDSGMKLFRQVLQRSIDVKYPDGIVAGLAGIGFRYIDSGKYETALIFFNRALRFSGQSGNKRDSAICINAIGITYFNLGNYTRAADYYFRALDALKRCDTAPSPTTVNILNNLCNIYLRLNQPEKSFYYIDEAERISRKGNFPYHLAMSLNNKANILMDNGKNDSARRIFMEVLEIGKAKNYPDLQAYANENIGVCNVHLGQYENALPYLQKARQMAPNRHNTLSISTGYAMGDALNHLGKYKAAEDTILDALKSASEAGLKDNVVVGYTKLSQVYKASGQYKKAFDCLDTLALIKDSLLSAGNATTINQMETRYRTAEKDRRIARNELVISRQENSLARKNLWIGGIAITAFLLTMIFVILYRNRQRVLEQKIAALEHVKEIEVLKAMLSGEEQERTRIARELHDGIGGMLSATMMQLTSINYDGQETVKIPAMREILRLLEEMGDEIRMTAHNLMPEVLLAQSLPDALGSYANYVREGGNLQVDFQCHGDFHGIRRELKLNVYRIVQELLKNITQHSGAGKALVQLVLHDQVLTITVEDNGNGFDTGQVKKGIGLYNLHSRVMSMNGHYSLRSEPGKGTSVDIEFELDK